MPRNGLPDGDCRVVWKRAWDYPDHVDDIMFNMVVLFDARVSYYLKAIRVSRPDDVFAVAKRYGILSEWVTPCWNDNPCRFTVLGSLDPETGIDLTISRD